MFIMVDYYRMSLIVIGFAIKTYYYSYRADFQKSNRFFKVIHFIYKLHP